MSRTRKDRPYWVKLNDPKSKRIADHGHRPHYGNRYDWDGICDIDKPHVRWTQRDRDRSCHYTLSRADERHYWDTPSVADTHFYYWGPMRSEERDTLKNAVKDYNTYGDVDEDLFLQENHRHARYGGVYWD